MLKQLTANFPAPERSEAAQYYFRYIDLVPAGDIRDVLSHQLTETIELLSDVTAEESLHRYASDKWSMREVVNHLSDTERSFVFRAFWFARRLGSELPSFEQEVAMAASGANEQSWESLVNEFRTVREATMSLFQLLPPSAWDARGVANGNEFTVRSLAYLTAGHVTHHLGILRDKYLLA
ncbi:MAG: hypothetical protein JWM95_2876 [Gemmatimonadetes bacterium]|nr:hypothetical protein [Gemmatimonadota bacterium]